MSRLRHLAAAAFALSACPSVEPGPPPEPEPSLVAWSPVALPLQAERRGRREVRLIAHLHSHHSHDACDNDPQPGGVPDEACLEDLRRGLCDARIDVALLSDHPGHAEEAEFEELFLLRGDDAPVFDGGVLVANRMVCPSGHGVLLMPGIESGEMMPLGLEAPVPGGYGQTDAVGSEAVRASGGLAWIAHTETRDLSQLVGRGLDGIELYQLHANIAPDLRRDYLGLDPYGFAADVGPFFFPEGRELDVEPQPDLALLAFLEPNEPSALALEYLGQTQRLGITGGTDAHRNVLPAEASDGDRMDSYRRMMRWFTTRALVDELTPQGVKEAMREGRTWVEFEALGLAEGFDFFAVAGDEVVEVGGELAWSEGLRLTVRPPSLRADSPGEHALPPDVRLVLLRADGSGRSVVAEGSGPMDVVAPGPGVYRVEAWVRPHHLTPHLGDVAELSEREVPWILTGAIFVR